MPDSTELGWTKREVAEAAGMKPKRFKKIMQGADPTLREISDIAYGMGCVWGL